MVYTDWTLPGTVGAEALRTLCRWGPETKDEDDDDEFVRSLLAMIVRSSFYKPADERSY